MAVIPATVMRLNGERGAPELPIPRSKIREYAGTVGFSSSFVAMVQFYDTTVLGEIMNGSNGSKGGKQLVGKGNPPASSG